MILLGLILCVVGLLGLVTIVFIAMNNMRREAVQIFNPDTKELISESAVDRHFKYLMTAVPFGALMLFGLLLTLVGLLEKAAGQD